MNIKEKNKSLKDYIPMERVKEATVEFNQKLEHFKEKYYDPVIEKFISTIKGADMKYIFNINNWQFKYGFDQKDLINLDPKNPTYAERIINAFFEEIAQDLSVEFVKVFMAKAPVSEKEPIYFIMEFKNPLK